MLNSTAMNLIDPIDYAKELEKTIITDGDKRPYRSFRIEPFYGQMATARSVGCNSRCAFCWVDPAKDNPRNQYRKVKPYSPREMFDELVKISSSKYGQCMMTEYFRISGCEPTIGMDHLLGILKIIEETALPSKGMLLETNGMILGNDEEVARAIAEFRERILVRLSFKAGTPEGLEKRAGVQGKFVDLPFKALQYLEKYKIPHHVVAATGDAKLMPEQERREFFKKLVTASEEIPISVLARAGGEVMDLFGLTRKRLSKAGLLDPDMVEGRRFLYEGILRSVFRVLSAKHGFKREVSQMGDEEYRRFEKEVLKGISKETVLQALDEAEFRQVEVQGTHREEVSDDNAKL
jgi:uncharacterized Fe-S cluster-containing radical SAM superfamily protein